MHGASGNQNRSPYAVDEKLFELGTSSVVCSYAEIKVDPDRITIYIKYSDKGRSKTLQSYGIIKNQ